MRFDPLSPSEVHVWMIERDPRADLDSLTECLSPAERQRAARLKVASAWESFVFNRAMTRRILADYAGIAAHEVPITHSSEGKPQWGEVPDGSPPLPGYHFNLSHCRELAILAVCPSRAVGVDLEAIDPRADYVALARQALSPRELSIFESLPPEDRAAALLRAWTRKEAFLKAVGAGLTRPLAHVEVTFGQSEPPQLLATGDHGEAPSDWLLEGWSPRPGWFAALAIPREGGSLQVRFQTATSLRDQSASLHTPVQRGSVGQADLAHRFADAPRSHK